MIKTDEDLAHLTSREKELCKQFKKMNDEQLLKLIAWQVKQLGHLPAKYEAECVRYLKNRFGPWPRMLEKAGVKPVSQTKLRRQERNRIRRKQQKMNARREGGIVQETQIHNDTDTSQMMC